jgi:hypothetical protein
MKRLKIVESYPSNPTEDYYYYKEIASELGIYRDGSWSYHKPFFADPIRQKITFEAIPTQYISNYQNNETLALSGTSSSGLPVSYTSSDTSVATVTGNTVTFVSAAISGSTVTITASQGGDSVFRAAIDVVQSLTVVDDVTDTDGDGVPDAFDKYPNSYQVAQTITFGVIADQMLSSEKFMLSATSSSGLPVSYESSNTAIATVSGNVVTFVSALVEGSTITITASQAGNESWFPAASIPQNVTIFDNVTDSDGDGIPDYTDPYPNSQSQTINFEGIANRAVIDGNLVLSATATSGLTVAYSSTSPYVTFNGSTAIFANEHPGPAFSNESTTIIASQSGGVDGNGVDWKAADNVQQTFNLSDLDFDGDGIPDSRDPNPNSLPQTITFGEIADQMLSAGALTLSATSSAGSGYVVSYASSNTAIATVSGNVVTFVSALVEGSTITITASQAGDDDYFPAAPVIRDLTIFDNVTDSDGDTIPDYTDPYPNSQSQTINFEGIANRAVIDGNLTLSATSSSALPVTYSTPDTNLLTINGNVVSFTGTGSVFTQQVSITASQAGGYNSANSTDWKAASPVQKTFDLSDLDSDGDGIPDSTDSYPNSQTQTISFGTIANRQVVHGNLTLSATSSSALPVTYSTPDTNLLTINGNVVSFTGTGSVFTQQVSITASQAGGYNSANSTDWKAASPVQKTFDLSDLDSDGDGIPDSTDSNPNTTAQTITFPTIGSINRSTNTYALNATSTSSVPITYSSSNTSVATVSGSTLTFVANSGTATITANQAANDDFFAATASQSLTIIDNVTDTDGDGVPDVDDGNPYIFDVFVRNYPTSATTNIADSPHDGWDNPVDVYVNNKIIATNTGTTTLGANFTFQDFSNAVGRGLKLVRTWSTIDGALNGTGSWTQPYAHWGSHDNVNYGTSTSMFHSNPSLTIDYAFPLYAPAGPLEACCGDGTPTYAAGSWQHINVDLNGDPKFDNPNGTNFSSASLAGDGRNIYRSYWNNLSPPDYAYVTPTKPDSRIVAAFLFGIKYSWTKPDNTEVDTNLYFRLNFV